MAILIMGVIALVGTALIVLGVLAVNAPGQPPDVRLGGVVPFVVGVLVLAVDFLSFLVWVAVT